MSIPAGGDGPVIGKGNSDKAAEVDHKSNDAGAHQAMLKTVMDATVGHKVGQEGPAVAALAQLTPKDIAKITPAEIAKFSPAMVEALKPEQILAMNSKQIGAFTPAQQNEMTPAQHEAALGAMRPGIKDKLSALGTNADSVTGDGRNSLVMAYYSMDAQNLQPGPTIENLRNAARGNA